MLLDDPDVILVDENDYPIGVMKKYQAHLLGKLHRAFSVFIINSKQEILLQQRAATKYHSPLLWTNACCSHPKPDETVLTAAKRRLTEELGLVSELISIGKFHYCARYDNGLTENEIDHVLIACLDEPIIQPNPMEVAAIRWINCKRLCEELNQQPEKFTVWLPQALTLVQLYMAQL